MELLAGSLSAADLHVVVMGEAFVGTIHPCKVYNILSVGAPVLYIGPEPSHVSDVLAQLKSKVCVRVAHGDVAGCVSQIRHLAGVKMRGEPEIYAAVAAGFSAQKLVPRFVAQLEGIRS
jgi:hypothetical protein